MQAFKLYFKIFKKSAFITSLIFIVVYALMTVLFSQVGASQSSSFELSKCKVSVIDEDNSTLSKELTEFLSKNTKPITLENNESSFKDALFFRQVDYIAIIPKGFETQFHSNTDTMIESMQLPDGANAMLIQNLINSYLSTAKLYLDGTGTIDYDAVNQDISIQTNVNILGGTASDKQTSEIIYVNYLSYVMLAIMIFIVPMVMMIVNEKDIKRRNLASPIKTTHYTWQMLLGNFVSMIVIYFIFLVLAIIIYGESLLNLKGALWALTLFCFSVFSLCLGFFISTFATKNSVWPIANLVSLGCGFLGGTFVPQQLLNETILRFGAINPVYWYIKTNNTIYELNTLNSETLKPVFLSTGILLAFACTFIAMTLVVTKMKRKSN